MLGARMAADMRRPAGYGQPGSSRRALIEPWVMLHLLSVTASAIVLGMLACGGDDAAKGEADTAGDGAVLEVSIDTGGAVEETLDLDPDTAGANDSDGDGADVEDVLEVADGDASDGEAAC